jgi:hypothetical protein
VKRLVAALAALVALAVAAPVLGSGAGLMSGAPSKWANIQVGITYRLYQPGNRLGFKLNKLKSISCGKGHEPWVAATYGTYKGILGSKTRGFSLYEGHPICSDPAESTKINGDPPVKVGGALVRVGVYCGLGKACTVNQGYKNGFTLSWRAKPSKPYKKNTWMQLDSSHLTFAQVIKIAYHLKKVG